MNPIIYTPHKCEVTTTPHVPVGSLWECGRCGNIWELCESWDKPNTRWEMLESPTRGHAIAAAVRRAETARAVWHG